MTAVELEEGEGPKDVTEVAVKERTHEREKRTEEGNCLSDDPAKNPSDGHAADPASPPEDSVIVIVLLSKSKSEAKRKSQCL